MKFCEVKMTERQGKSTKAGLYGPRRVDFPPSIRSFSPHPEGRCEKRAWMRSKALTVVFTMLRSLFAHQIAFFVQRRIHAMNVNTP
jgi:hypothetical protein